MNEIKKVKKKQFKLFELCQDSFIDLKLSSDTISELIFEAKYKGLVRWVILDTVSCKLPIIQTLDTSFNTVIPAVRIANQVIEEGKTVYIPTQITLSRNGSPITVWDRERLDSHLIPSKKRYSLSNTTILDKVKVLQIYPEYVSVQAYQVSTSTLKALISSTQGLIYDYDVVPFNFKEIRLKLNRDENKILFL
jgi:hypothetical protein